MDPPFIREPPLAAYWERCIGILVIEALKEILTTLQDFSAWRTSTLWRHFKIVSVEARLTREALFRAALQNIFGSTLQHIMVTSEIIVWHLSQFECRCLFGQIPHALKGASLNTTEFVSRVGQILMSPKRATYSQSNTTVQSPCMNLMPRICTADGCALSTMQMVLRRVPRGETWRHSCERSSVRL